MKEQYFYDLLTIVCIHVIHVLYYTKKVERLKARIQDDPVSWWGVLIYKSVSDLNVTIVQPRDINFRGRTTLTWSNFFIVRFARVKNIPFNFLVF